MTALGSVILKRMVMELVEEKEDAMARALAKEPAFAMGHQCRPVCFAAVPLSAMELCGAREGLVNAMVRALVRRRVSRVGAGGKVGVLEPENVQGRVPALARHFVQGFHRFGDLTE